MDNFKKTIEPDGKNRTKICISNDIIIGNTLVQPKKGGRLATWRNYDGTIARQIDYFMI